LVIFIALERLSIGKHVYAIPRDNLNQLARWQWYFTLFFIIGISFLKLSVTFFLLRIIHWPYYRRFLYSMIGLLVSLMLVWFGSLIIQCVPVSDILEPLMGTSRCNSRTAHRDLDLFNNGELLLDRITSSKRLDLPFLAANAATDLIFASMSIPVVWTLHVSPRTRISLVAILSLGFV
jgi:hypothetical protein